MIFFYHLASTFILINQLMIVNILIPLTRAKLLHYENIIICYFIKFRKCPSNYNNEIEN